MYVIGSLPTMPISEFTANKSQLLVLLYLRITIPKDTIAWTYARSLDGAIQTRFKAHDVTTVTLQDFKKNQGIRHTATAMSKRVIATSVCRLRSVVILCQERFINCCSILKTEEYCQGKQ